MQAIRSTFASGTTVSSTGTHFHASDVVHGCHTSHLATTLTFASFLDKGTPKLSGSGTVLDDLNLDLHSWPEALTKRCEGSVLVPPSPPTPERKARWITPLHRPGGLFSWNKTLRSGSSSAPALLKPSEAMLLGSCSAGDKTHHKIQLISPGFHSGRKPGKQRVPAVLKHFFSACFQHNMAFFFAFFFNLNTAVVLILCVSLIWCACIASGKQQNTK